MEDLSEVRSDRELVKRLLSGEERAFDEFFKSQFQRLFRFAMARLKHDATTSEELVQATLCKAVTKLDTYRGEASLFSWLCTFCRHEISAHFRQTKSASAEVPLIEETPEVRAALDSLAALQANDPDSSLRRTELSRQVQRTLDDLPARYGDVLEWKYVEGLSVKEIARRLGLGPKAAESLMTRAREAFRAAFTEPAPAASGQRR